LNTYKTFYNKISAVLCLSYIHGRGILQGTVIPQLRCDGN